MTTMKSTSDASRAASARGCRTAVGSGESSAATMPGALAKVSATASERLRASWVLSRRTWSTRATTAATTSSSTITRCRTNTCPATLRPLRTDRRAAAGRHRERPSSLCRRRADAAAPCRRGDRGWDRPMSRTMCHVYTDAPPEARGGTHLTGGSPPVPLAAPRVARGRPPLAARDPPPSARLVPRRSRAVDARAAGPGACVPGLSRPGPGPVPWWRGRSRCPARTAAGSGPRAGRAPPAGRPAPTPPGSHGG